MKSSYEKSIIASKQVIEEFFRLIRTKEVAIDIKVLATERRVEGGGDGGAVMNGGGGRVHPDV